MMIKYWLQQKLYNNWGFRSDNKASQPASAALRFDREEARNPQLYIVLYVTSNTIATVQTSTDSVKNGRQNANASQN